MDRGAWWAIVHGVTESDMTKHACTNKTSNVERVQLPYPCQCLLFSIVLNVVTLVSAE